MPPPCDVDNKTARTLYARASNEVAAFKRDKEREMREAEREREKKKRKRAKLRNNAGTSGGNTITALSVCTIRLIIHTVTDNPIAITLSGIYSCISLLNYHEQYFLCILIKKNGLYLCGNRNKMQGS